MRELMNIGSSFKRYSDVLEKMAALRESGLSEDDIAKELGMSIFDMRLFRRLIIRATNAMLRLDIFDEYIKHGVCSGEVNTEIVAKVAKEFGLPESSVLRHMNNIITLYAKQKL